MISTYINNYQIISQNLKQEIERHERTLTSLVNARNKLYETYESHGVILRISLYFMFIWNLHSLDIKVSAVQKKLNQTEIKKARQLKELLIKEEENLISSNKEGQKHLAELEVTHQKHLVNHQCLLDIHELGTRVSSILDQASTKLAPLKSEEFLSFVIANESPSKTANLSADSVSKSIKEAISLLEEFLVALEHYKRNQSHQFQEDASQNELWDNIDVSELTRNLKSGLTLVSLSEANDGINTTAYNVSLVMKTIQKYRAIHLAEVTALHDEILAYRRKLRLKAIPHLAEYGIDVTEDQVMLITDLHVA